MAIIHADIPRHSQIIQLAEDQASTIVDLFDKFFVGSELVPTIRFAADYHIIQYKTLIIC